MGNKDISNSEDILVKSDVNNLIYVDPNSVVVDGEIEPRSIRPENLMMYVNLEADIIPRSILVSSNDKNTLISIAKGTLNFLRNQNGDDFDTSWTNAFLEKTEITKKSTDINGNKINVGTGEFFQSDGTGQSFGIDSITITTKGLNSIPQVTINFIDVRGKTLFESPENSPYKAFFHLPWPIFYLTVKGYYGKAIRYRLHLVKFTTKFNEGSGNFESMATFVGATFAHISDIPLNGMLNCPYMFRVENSTRPTFNEGSGTFEKKISKSSRGYAILRSVYNELKQKKLIDPNFPVKTLKELITISESLDKILENEIFQKVDFKVFAGIVEYEDGLSKLGEYINIWTKKNLSTVSFTGGTRGDELFYLLNISDKTDKSKIKGDSDDTLEKGLNRYKELLSKTNLFANNVINKTSSDFTKLKKSNDIKNIDDYIGYKDKQVGLNIDLLGEDYKKMVNEFLKQKDALQKDVEKEINTILRDPKKGIGFEPTIRNIFAVVLANAEVYIRLLKDTHNKAFQDAETRKNLLVGFSDETPGGGAVYPWPEVKKSTGSGSKSKVVAYPGDKDLLQKLKTNDKKLWPEIDFVEDYIAVTTKKYDPLSEKEGGIGKIDYVFEDNLDEGKIKKISTLDTLINGFGKSLGVIPYTEKTLVSILYEIFERSYYITLFDSFNSNTIRELSNFEFENLSESIKHDNDVIDILRDSVKSFPDLLNLMRSLSPFDRYPYYVDRLPTVGYISSIIDSPHIFEQYYDPNRNSNNNTNPKPVNNDSLYVKLSDDLLRYQSDTYRTEIYPFNSKTYLSYLKQNSFTDNEFKFGNTLKVNTSEGFISTEVNPELWVKDNFKNNIFSNKLYLGTTTVPVPGTVQTFGLDTKVNILNTPYFHKQLYSDFFKSGRVGKYVGSAYLLLNSLPFKDLEDRFSNNIKVSSLFREIGSTHFIPYHLLLKWGSIYHRYKKKILDNNDILDGFLSTSNITTNFNGSEFFDNNSGFTFTLNGSGVTYSNNSDVGIHPYYDAIFHQVVNGYNHYDVFSGSPSFDVNVVAGGIIGNARVVTNGMRYWTTFVDNSKYDPKDLRFTVLPSDGGNSYIPQNNFFEQEQKYTRIIWEDEGLFKNFSGLTFASPYQYTRNYNSGSTTNDNIFSMDTNYRKVIDLIATFNPDILNEMEEMFINFATSTVKEELPYKKFESVFYDKFQSILKDLCSVEKISTDTGRTDQIIIDIKNRQKDKIQNIHTKLLSKDNLIKFTNGNPKEIDSYVVNGFANINSGSTFSYNTFNIAQVSPNSKYIDLYLGEDIDNKYLQFFATNDIELSEDNVIQFRSLAQIFAGHYLNTASPTKPDFIDYIRKNVLVIDSTTTLTKRHTEFLQNLISQFSKLTKTTDAQRMTPVSGFGDEILKLETYNFFKSFNDKWIGGNSIGQRLLFEEFLFLDKANKDIGSDAYFNIQKLIPLGDTKNQKLNLYSVISVLIQGTGFDMRVLPSYINFYGANYSNKVKLIPSKKLAKNLFGTFLEVDYQESSPKVILQYTGPTSKHLDLNKYNKDYKFIDDSFNIQDQNRNPLIITAPAVFDNAELSKSNRVVAFEVSFGDQNQGIFKGVQLDQSSLKNTTESFIAMENLGRSESGANAYQVDIGLYDIYRQSSYTCQVSSMGNVMIQPTMYFYLKNIPMFKGTYWITEVTHSIRNNNITTNFTGTRIPYASLPDPKEATMATYRPLFESIVNKAQIKVKESLIKRPESEISLTVQDGRTVTVDLSGKSFNGETLVHRSGVNIFGVPYNGFSDNKTTGEKYIQLIENKNYSSPDKNYEWLRAAVVKMGGGIYKIDDDMTMGVINNIKTDPKPKPLLWGEIKDSSSTSYFYGTRFQTPNVISGSKIITANAKFINPKNNKEVFVSPSYDLNSTVKKVTGPVHVGPLLQGYGICMSDKLMRDLGLIDGDIVYFKLY
jgi:hypothetical protein